MLGDNRLHAVWTTALRSDDETIFRHSLCQFQVLSVPWASALGRVAVRVCQSVKTRSSFGDFEVVSTRESLYQFCFGVYALLSVCTT